jgi:hypothetical protein
MIMFYAMLVEGSGNEEREQLMHPPLKINILIF